MADLDIGEIGEWVGENGCLLSLRIGEPNSLWDNRQMSSSLFMDSFLTASSPSLDFFRSFCFVSRSSLEV